MSSRRVIPALLALILSASVGAGQPGSDDGPATGFGGVEAKVVASRDATLSFTFPVEIGDVLVRGGQRVKKGDLLIQGRDDEARYQRDLQKTQADSDLDVQKAKVALDQAQVEFDAQKKMKEDKRVGAEIEYQRAEAVLNSKKVELDIAKLQRVLQTQQLQFRQATVDRHAIKAPFDGLIDKVLVEVGEVKKDTEPVLKIVSVDPLWIDVHAPTGETLTLNLKPGDKAWVVLELPGQPSVRVGKVVEVGAEADFAAKTRRIRVELSNPEEWPAGIGAWVRFTQPEGEWSKRMAPPVQKKAQAGNEAGPITRIDPR
jgi:RND family efflux transporter MFP subunit